jgi:Tol biopolymer transport system component/tRNA A-37 threonylcarbamoyl transferase component Bud32
MNPERLRQIEELYHSAYERIPDQREAFLNAACGNDAELLRDVWSLLAQDPLAGPMERPVLQVAADLLIDPPAVQWSPGTQLGPYEIVSRLGHGGMGEVFKARDARLGRDVAIKTAHEEFSGRFQREVRAISALNHPNICTLYDIGPNYLVMELVEGADLAGPVPIDTAIGYARQIVAGLEAAHEKGIIHRDLKPANIKVTPEGAVKILDFGLAKAIEITAAGQDTAPTFSMTEKGMILGTAAYMSPEQARGESVDKRADIWAFGVILYELLTGKMLFGGSTNVSDALAAVLTREPDFSALPQGTPPRVRRVLEHCLRKDPKQRLRDIGDARVLLDELAAEPVVEHRRHNARIGWLLAGVFAGLLAGFAAFHYRTAPAPAAVTRFEVPPPEGTTWGPLDFPAISPDGSRIVFGATKRDGTRSLWMRTMDSVNTLAIPGTESNSNSVGPGAWSPDGRAIAYVSDNRVRRLEIGVGSTQILASAPAFGRPAWSPAGIILFTGNESPYQLYQVPASGGDVKPATGSGTEEDFPSFLPDGRRFLYSRRTGTDTALYTGNLGSKEGERLAAGTSGTFVPPNWLLYLRGSTLVAQPFEPGKHSLSGGPIPIAEQVATIAFDGGGFSVSQSGVLAYRRTLPVEGSVLTWYDRQGKRLAAVGEPAFYTNPALSPDGKRLAVGRSDSATNTRDIWVLDLARGGSSRFTFDKADDMNPLWSPDGSRIAFSSVRKGRDRRDIYWKSADGAGADELLLDSAGSKSLEDWSPDGKLLLFNLNNEMHAETHALPISGDRKPYPVLKAPFTQTHGRFSPDGRWIAYSSNESGRLEVFVQNFPPAGVKWQISTGGGDEPSWRRDGKEIYFTSGTKLKAVDVKAVGSSFEAGIPKDLFEVPTIVDVPRRNRYVATADGQRFLFVTTQRSFDTVPFIVVQNWQTALKH